MSTYERIATILIILLIIPMVLFSVREIKEPEGLDAAQARHNRFDDAFGPEFKIGPFTTVVDQQSSGGTEADCDRQQTVIVGTLHDIKARLETQNIYTSATDVFEINESMLQFFCQKNASVTLSDSSGNTLLLTKVPFVREVPPESDPSNIGTKVHINATYVPAGASIPSTPSVFGEVLIPDRYLDATSSRR